MLTHMEEGHHIMNTRHLVTDGLIHLIVTHLVEIEDLHHMTTIIKIEKVVITHHTTKDHLPHKEPLQGTLLTEEV